MGVYVCMYVLLNVGTKVLYMIYGTMGVVELPIQHEVKVYAVGSVRCICQSRYVLTSHGNQ